MKTYLVTGAAGFIGVNFLKYILKKKVIVVDSLTYAGNLGTINILRNKYIRNSKSIRQC